MVYLELVEVTGLLWGWILPRQALSTSFEPTYNLYEGLIATKSVPTIDDQGLTSVKVQ